MASGTQDEEPRRRNLKKDEYCNDSTVTHTCCSFVGLSEKKAKEGRILQ